MRVFRLIRKKYGIELSGKGAALSGNRWNSKGTELIYCADSRALAMAEVAVHLSLSILPKDYVMVEIEIPNSVSISSLKTDDLPQGWNSFPHLLDTQKIGDDFVAERKSCVLKVPSAVVPGDFNFLINSNHLDFSAIKIVGYKDFPFDQRLFQ
ncbi:MAG: RES family NAD+ phosphorylase [Algoriphagus sp.]|jgi:RES domain-containing protein|uniref:RES family NAD+ phosphorylase n=1 Tax=Algoriphagus sp. TaxID=1872435 RepID=UPI00272464C6|nr:RES family NAD+ phosphorylase [Algoriphagus sp.]MDO8966504.1 RES family NAD+ phosphorylase [Algoriphagus sp.]MDP2041661.1 RES family NAD+ phosphorylase [Algoriphagus sp.]MDP3201950.1 RES family NAD+ phosphorylase [Algoriphagus sp.]MDP3471485.1 RES family NAD+ phosphorylase [Algoriphagus sp.]